MLDPNLLRGNLYAVAEQLKSRGYKLDVKKVSSLEESRKILQVETENLQAKCNFRSKFIGQAKARGEDINQLCLEVSIANERLNKAKAKLEVLKTEIRNLALEIPNIPDKDVPIGKDKSDNIELKRWSTPRKFDFQIRDHITLGEMHDGLDFTTAAKITGSRFVVMKGEIARLHRALIQFMLDLHTKKHGYNETYLPYLVNHKALYGTGQLPKFANDLFYVHSLEKEMDGNYALIPTAEVPLTNLMQNKIFYEGDLPIKLTAHSPCFRLEAGSYGSDTRGLIRTHQFDKVEMVQIVRPEESMNALEEMTLHAEKVLELLVLPYRRMVLCTGDMSFSACKTFDLEVWVPAQNTYREISSCSNTWDFQARRIKARYRKNKGDKKTRFVHILNGSGLAVSRTLVAVLENYQQADGRIEIPEVLYPYMYPCKKIYPCIKNNKR